MERRRCSSCDKDVYSADVSSDVWKCPHCEAYVLAGGSGISDIHKLIGRLSLKEHTKRDLQFWAIKKHENRKDSATILWGMVRGLAHEGLIERDDFEKLAGFAWKK